MRLLGVATVLLGAALLAGSSALASQQAGPTLTISSTTLKASWKEGWFKGSVKFKVSVGGSAQLDASLRSTATHKVVANMNFSVGSSGSATKTLAFPARPVPGAYVLDVSGTSGGSSVKADRNVTVPTPSEGVVDRSYASKSQSGSSVHVIHHASKIWATFHFLTRPKGGTVKFIWRTPSYKFVGAVTKPYHTTIQTYVWAKLLSKNGPLLLQKGTWYCIMTAGGKVSKRVSVKVT
jgi:hypothetical protein